MLRFNLDIDVISDKWSDDDEKEVFIKNFTDVIEMGLFKMTVSDGSVKNVTVEEIDDD